jgi:hypothetical protein
MSPARRPRQAAIAAGEQDLLLAASLDRQVKTQSAAAIS